MSNAEWINSIPGNDPRKGVFLNCVGCHTLERVMRSTHSAEDLLKITLPRMQSYVNQSIPQHPQLRRGERLMEERGDQRVQIYKATADFLATVNLGSKPQWSFPLDPMPRPGGRATRVIYTEYDLPRDTIEPHDVILDKDGMAWYSNFGEQNSAGSIPRPARSPNFRCPSTSPASRPDSWRCAPTRKATCGSATCTRPRSSSSTASPRSSRTGRCRRSRTSTPPRSTW